MSRDFRDIWDFSDPAASEERFRTAAGAAYGVERALLETQVARALGLQDRFEEGHAVLDALHPGTPEVAARVALERGRLWRSAGEVERALPAFRDAVAVAQEADLADLHLDALHMVALAQSSPEDQIRAGRDALAAARASGDPGARRWEPSLLNNLGCALVDAGRPEEALAVFEEALAARSRDGSAEDVRVARWMVAWALRLTGDTEAALEIQLALREELDREGLTDPYVDEELALLGSGGQHG